MLYTQVHHKMEKKKENGYASKHQYDRNFSFRGRDQRFKGSSMIKLRLTDFRPSKPFWFRLFNVIIFITFATNSLPGLFVVALRLNWGQKGGVLEAKKLLGQRGFWGFPRDCVKAV